MVTKSLVIKAGKHQRRKRLSELCCMAGARGVVNQFFYTERLLPKVQPLTIL